MNINSIISVSLIIIANNVFLITLFYFIFRWRTKKRACNTAVIEAKKKSVLATNIMCPLSYILLIGASVISSGIIYWNLTSDSDDSLINLMGEPEPPAGVVETSKAPVIFYPHGLNLVFFADGYESWEEFDNDVNSLTEELIKVEPWKSYSDYNIFRIKPDTSEQLCSIKTEEERKPVLRCQDSINEYLRLLGLQRFKFIVLSRQDFQSWANVSRLDNSGIFFSVPEKLEGVTARSYGYLFDHLLGHAFGLKDEEYYVLAKDGGAPHTPDGPNCAPDKKTAEKWWGDLTQQYPDKVGYYSTCCGSKDYIKSSKSSLMNFNEMENFVPEYGPVSERYLKKILEYCFSGQPVSYEDDQSFFDQYPEFAICIGKNVSTE